jgi:hypothetical protein
MRQNKVLGLAIATALSMSVSSSYAGDLKVYYGGWDPDSIPTTADTSCSLQGDGQYTPTGGGSATDEPNYPIFASEYMFDPVEAVPDGGVCGTADDLDNGGNDGHAASKPYDTTSDADTTHAGLAVNDRYIYAVYTVEETLGDNFNAKFSLSNGAAFGNEIDLATGTNLDFVAHPSGTHASVTPNGGGDKGDSEVTFLVQPASSSPFNRTKADPDNSTLVLRFQLTDLEALQSPGEEIKMTVSLFDSNGTNPIDTVETATVAASARGSDIELEADGGPAEIDVSTGSVNFIGNGIITPTMVSLGTLTLDYEAGSIVADGSQWIFGSSDPRPESATLTVTNGNFAASLSTTDGGTGNGTVFLNLDKDETYDTDNSNPTTDPADIPATSVTADTAIWELDEDDVDAMRLNNTSYITILADGTTEINDFNDPPEATFVVTYGGGNKDTFKKKLLQIKRNGTVCTLYNVPNINALDVMNLRITNTSSQAGVLRGTLRLMDGTILFKNELLLGDETAPGEVAPNQTVRLTSQNIDDVSVAAGNASGWQGRAILTVSSNVTSMEMFGLLRSSSGGPLINMSVGGSGSGCD